ncbi:MAG: radical SAM protein, partial [Candidatus Bathyarchaeota archaeon]
MSSKAYREIIQYLLKIPNPTKQDLDHIKMKISKRHELNKVPSNAEIIVHLRPKERTKLLKILRRKTVRTISGVTVIAVMTKPSPCTPLEYQKQFIKQCLEAIAEKNSKTFEAAKKIAETSRIRNVGITLETRPDWAKKEQVDRMLSMGVTRVEIGVQNIYDDIYEKVNRGHKISEVIEATQIMKDSGLKVVYHLMPGLPGSNFKRDLEGFRTIFKNPNFKPDMIKLYPCLVIKGTKLYDWWKQGNYQPYTTDEAARLIAELKKFIPPWVRIMRVQRD